jgi:hypothetical protein
MAVQTLQQIQDQIAFEIDGNASISTSNSDWGYRLYPINRALSDWAETYDWEVLKKVHNGLISTSTANASYALPSDFRKLDGFPRVGNAIGLTELTAVDPSKTTQYVDTDGYVNILGSNNGGYVMFIHAGTLSSGASVQFTYYASPVSLTSTGSLTECPDPTYLVQRSLYYIYKAREDGRFPEAKAEAEKILARMVENENVLGVGYKDRNVGNWLKDKHHFRIGRD